MTRVWLITLLLVLNVADAAEVVRIQKEMPFLAARRQLIQDKWHPVDVHKNEPYELMGVEHDLARLGIREFESCSIDYSNCILHYRRRGECLTVYSIGEKVEFMKVVGWSSACPGQSSQTKRSTEK